MRTARANMIENQIRAGGVHLQSVFDALDAICREDFVPSSCRAYAYADMEIPLPCGENMLAPLTEARILQAADIRRNDTVLEIGSRMAHNMSRLWKSSRFWRKRLQTIWRTTESATSP